MVIAAPNSGSANVIGLLKAKKIPWIIALYILFQVLYTSKTDKLAVESHLRCNQQQKEHVLHKSSTVQKKERNKCCVECTTPKNECCLFCSDVASPREHDLLMATMEGSTHHVMETFEAANHNSVVKAKHVFLENRAWAGNSHIGNRPAQATFYYDWIRYIQRNEGNKAKQICEIGMNGGHSAIIFLAGLYSTQKDSEIHLAMFDLAEWEYTTPVEKYINALYPGIFVLHAGDSRDTVPKWTESNKKNGVYCDVFSVDGNHEYEPALADITNAAKATRKGGYVILDDMNLDGPTRKAFDEVLRNGILTEAKCVEDVRIKVGYENRIDETNARDMKMSWCTARVA